MKIQTINSITGLRRLAFAAAALAVASAAALPVFAGQASAAQVTTRSIRMSSSAASATGVSYNVVFNPGTTTTVGGIVVDICANTPIPGDATCTYPAGFTFTGTPTATVNSGMGTGWTFSGLQGGAAGGQTQVFKASNTTAQSLSTATPVDFTITSATNPSTTNTTFYARIMTFNTAANMDSQYTATGTARATTFANQVDYGGVALSTAAQIGVTAKIQETLSFCVYTNANCAAGGTAVTLGDTNGVLSTAGPFVDTTTKYDISTNAGGNAVVRFKAGLPTSGANTLASIGATATTSAAGTSQFGLCTYESTGSGLTANSPYAGGTGSCSATTQTAGTGTTGGVNGAQFAFDTNGTTGSTSTYGSGLSTKTAGNSSTGRVSFIGNTSPTQAAGIYTNTFTFIATGTY